MSSSSSSDSDDEPKKKIDRKKSEKKSRHEIPPKKEKSLKTDKRKREDSSSDEGLAADQLQPVKKAKPSSSGSKAETLKNADGEEMIAIGNMRYVTVRTFHGKTLVDIREYYVDKGSGQMKPGKKGISLSKEQFNNFKNILTDIEAKL